MGSRRPARHADVAVVARGGTVRHGHPGRTIRGIRRQRAADRQGRVHRRHVPLRHPATVGNQPQRHHVRGTARGRSHHGFDDDGGRPEGDMVRHAGPVAAADRTARLGQTDHALQRQITRRVAAGRTPREPVARGRRHPAEREQRRQPRHGSEVRRLQAARGGPCAQRVEQRRVPAGPLRAPGRRRRRARAIVTSPRRALRLHCAERERGQGCRRVAIDGRHARGPDAHIRAERHDRYQQPGDSGNYRRRARQRRSRARAAAAPGRSRSRGLPQHRDHARQKPRDSRPTAQRRRKLPGSERTDP